MLKVIKKHYYWILLGVMVLLMAIRGGIYNNMSGLHQGPVTEGLGITPVQFSLAVSAYSVVAMLRKRRISQRLEQYSAAKTKILFSFSDKDRSQYFH